MKTTGCFAIIIKKNTVLLVKRKDYPLWDLPGGTKEINETIEDCVIREVYEETGLDVKILQHVGKYHRPKYDDIQHLFLCEAIGGKEIISGSETAALKWSKLNRLPLLMIPNRKGQIKRYKKGYLHVEKTIKDNHILLVLQRLMQR